MQCADCHFAQDSHGNGLIYGEVANAVEIGCKDCHGTARRATRICAPRAPPRRRRAPTSSCCATRTAAAASSGSSDDGAATGADPALDRRSEARMGGQPGQGQRRSTCASPAATFNAASTARARAKLMARSGAETGSLRVRPRRRRRRTAPTATDEMACFTCHLSWTTSCGGCHLPIEANWNRPRCTITRARRRATSRPTTRRSRATTCSSSAGTDHARATDHRPGPLVLGAGAVVDQHQPRAHLRPAAADLGGGLLEPGVRAALPAHGAHDRDQDLHRLPLSAGRTTTTRSWRSCCCRAPTS